MWLVSESIGSPKMGGSGELESESIGSPKMGESSGLVSESIGSWQQNTLQHRASADSTGRRPCTAGKQPCTWKDTPVAAFASRKTEML